LEVADGELWTDDEWTEIASTTKRNRHVGMANEKRSIGINKHEGTAMHETVKDGNAMDTEHCKCDGNSECGSMCDREYRKSNQRLRWEIEHID
jgi:hypothetical protein